MKTTFVMGDTVVLKSGGERMAVELVDTDDIFCGWFNKNSEVERKTFHSSTLKLVTTGSEITEV